MVDHYTYRVSWSPEDQEFVATCAEFPSLSWLDADRAAALTGIVQLVHGVLADMRENGETPPIAIAEEPASGKFQVRIPPALHRRLKIEAAEEKISLNRHVAKKLATADQ